MLENRRKGSGIKGDCVPRTGAKRSDVNVYKYTHGSFNSFILKPGGLKSFQNRPHKTSQVIWFLGF